MEDKQVEQLMTEYASGLGHFERCAPKRLALPWKPLLVTATGVAAVAVLVLVPRKAEAAPMEKLVHAFQKTKYWRLVVSMRNTHDKKWSPGEEILYYDGKIQSVSGFPPSHRLTTIIDGPFEYSDFKNEPFILKTPLDNWIGSVDFFDPMSHAMRFYPKKLEFVRQESKNYRGLSAYILKRSNAPNAGAITITVEKSTNLPLLVQSYGKSTKDRFEIRQEYFYDQPKVAPVIAPNPNKPIIEPGPERKAAIKKWEAIETSPDRPIVYESAITPGGIVWITVGVKDYSKPCWVPKKVMGNYTLGTMFMMSSYGRKPDFFVHSHEIVTYCFIPTDNKVPHPDSVDVEFALQPMYTSKGVSKTTQVSCPLGSTKWNFPDFYPAFAFQTPGTFIDERFYNIRAHAKLARKEYAGAAADFEQEYDCFKDRQFRSSSWSQPLKAAAECYDKLGMKAKAKATRQRMQREEAKLSPQPK